MVISIICTVFVWILHGCLTNMVYIMDPNNSVIKRLWCIWVVPCKMVSLGMWGQQRPRPTCTFLQSDKGLYCPLTESLDTIECIDGQWRLKDTLSMHRMMWIGTFCACLKALFCMHGPLISVFICWCSSRLVNVSVLCISFLNCTWTCCSITMLYQLYPWHSFIPRGI